VLPENNAIASAAGRIRTKLANFMVAIMNYVRCSCVRPLHSHNYIRRIVWTKINGYSSSRGVDADLIAISNRRNNVINLSVDIDYDPNLASSLPPGSLWISDILH
jgi:hypothetical protein